jgi:hypothetical protein
MKHLQELRVVVASPRDVQSERNSLVDVAAELNRGIAKDRAIHIEISRWEIDAAPGFHLEGPQGIIDSVLRIEDCDLLVGIFWKRFGTPTADAKSGTEHEFRKAYEAWKRDKRPQIMMYFNEKPYSPKTREEIEQWGQVLGFKSKFPKEGLSWSYNGKNEFEKLVRQHITQFIRHIPIEALRLVPNDPGWLATQQQAQSQLTQQAPVALPSQKKTPTTDQEPSLLPLKTYIPWIDEDYELKRFEEALAACDQAIRLDPNSALAYNNKGFALERLGRKEDAQQAFKRARQLGYHG